MKRFSWYSLSTPSYLLALFPDMTKHEFIAFLRLLAEQLPTCSQPLGAETKTQLVSFAYTASCHCPSSKDLVFGSSVLMNENELKVSVRIVASTNFYADGKTRHDEAIIRIDEKHNHLKSRNSIPV